MNNLFKILLFIGSPVIVSNLGHGILKGKIKSITYTGYKILQDSAGINSKSIERADYTKYTEDRNFIMQSTGVWSGTGWIQSVDHYNKLGLIVEHSVYHHNRSDISGLKEEPTDISWQNRSIYSYNTKGLLSEKKTYRRFFTYDSVLTDYIIYTYDSLGNRNEFDSIKTGGDKIRKTIDGLHDSVILIPASALLMSDTSNTITEKSVVKQYDKRGNLIHSENTNNQYYKKGILQEHEIMRNGEWKEIFRYNHKGEMTEYIVYFPDGTINRRYTYSSDKHGISIANEYDKNGKLKEKTISKKVFDRMGNITIDSTFTNDTLTYIRTQQFEYY